MKAFLNFLKKIEKEKDLNKSLLVLAVASVLITAASLIGASTLTEFSEFSLPTEMTASAAVVLFFLLFIGGLILGAIVSSVTKILGYKGQYFHGISVISYPLFFFSIGIIITALLGYLGYGGSVIAFFVLLYFNTLAVTSFFKLFMDFYKTNLVSTCILGLIVWTIFALSLSLSGLVSVPTVLKQLSAYLPLQ